MAYECKSMSQAQIEEFLGAERFAVVGTNRADGPPQLTPVWYLYENDSVYMTIYANSAKYRNLRRDPRVTVCIVGDCPDARAVMVYGRAELHPEGSAAWVDDVVWRLVRRYHDSDREARSYLEVVNAGGKGILVVVVPDKVIAEDYN